MSEQFRRTDPRYDRRIEVEISVGGSTQQAMTRNISIGGMYVEATEAIPVETEVRIRFKVPSQPEPIEVTGQVRWVEQEASPGVIGIGVRFNGLRAREVWALNRFFQT